MGTCHIEKPPGWEVFLLWNIKMTGRAGLSSGKETVVMVYTGALSQEALAALLDGCVAADGALSYFTLNLYSGEKMLFSSSHYGSEVYWFQDSFAEIGFLMMLAKKHPCIKGFDKR